MSPYQIEQCMGKLGYNLSDPHACLQAWMAAFNSTPPEPPEPSGGWTLSFVTFWLSAYYSGKNPCA